MRGYGYGSEKESGVKGFIDDIMDLADANEAFRRVVYTGRHLQMVLMRLMAGEAIGLEAHAGHDQFFHIIDGVGVVTIDGVGARVSKAAVVLVPAGARHNIVNAGDGPLALYTLYAPPEHRDGLVHDSLDDAARAPAPFDGRTSE